MNKPNHNKEKYRWNVSASFWGTYIWTTFHVVAFGAPEVLSKKDREEYALFYMSLLNVIPCSVCRNAKEKHLGLTPLNEKALSTRESLIQWTYNYHKNLNMDIHSREYIPSYESFYNYYMKYVIK